MADALAAGCGAMPVRFANRICFTAAFSRQFMNKPAYSYSYTG
ncbi:MAG: hypothetical protein [Olavius algarvensis Delta 4 endosymbiont]|nr:MAG: hypothetical protein [Olavius algarvensis Delta 4 endosymbiont]